MCDVKVWKELLPLLRKNAKLAQEFALNHRGVKIGCAVLGCQGGVFDPYSIGWNCTLQPLTETQKNTFKPCAEKWAVIDSILRDLTPVGLVMYTGHNQKDDETGLLQDVLPPCSNCVRWMETLLPPQFRIGSFGVKGCAETYMEWTLHELGLIHRDALRFGAFV